MNYQYGKYPLCMRVIKHWEYLKYVLRHKWYVFLECCKLGIPFRGLLHDMSKFRPSEWFPYAEMFYGKYGNGFNGGYAWEHTANLQACDKYNEAWLKHQNRNPHHWQYWVLINDDDPAKCIFIPEKYYLEMIADWRGFSRAINGIDNTNDWYEKHKMKIKLHDFTRERIEILLKDSR